MKPAFEMKCRTPNKRFGASGGVSSPPKKFVWVFNKCNFYKLCNERCNHVATVIKLRISKENIF
jgi:hypothetical protein